MLKAHVIFCLRPLFVDFTHTREKYIFDFLQIEKKIIVLTVYILIKKIAFGS